MIIENEKPQPQCFSCILRESCMPGYDDTALQYGADNGFVPTSNCNESNKQHLEHDR